MTKTEEKQAALLKYLIASKQHRDAEAKLGDDEFLPFDYSTIEELGKCYLSEEVTHIIIHKDELIDKFLNV